MARAWLGPWAIRDLCGEGFLGCAELRFAGDGIEGIDPDEVEAGGANAARHPALPRLWDACERQGETMPVLPRGSKHRTPPTATGRGNRAPPPNE